MKAGPVKGGLARDIRNLGLGNHAHATDKKSAGVRRTVASSHDPNAAVGLVFSAGDLSAKLHVRPHVEFVCYEA